MTSQGRWLPENAAWLEAMGLEPPERGAERNPTLAELRSVVRDLGYSLQEAAQGDNLVLWVTSRDGDMTITTFENYSHEPGADVPRWWRFKYGEPRLLVNLTERLVRCCGSFLLTQSAGEYIIVEAGTEPDADWVCDRPW